MITIGKVSGVYVWKYTTGDYITCKMDSKDVLWNFEDLKLLKGTDLPIFGGDTYPCISIQLRYIFNF